MASRILISPHLAKLAVANIFATASFARWGEIKILDATACIQESLDGVSIRFGYLKGQAIGLWILIDSERGALAIPRPKLSNPHVWGAGLLDAVSRRD